MLSSLQVVRPQFIGITHSLHACHMNRPSHLPSFDNHNIQCKARITKFLIRLRLKCDGTREETRFRLSTKRTSPFKSAGASVQSTTGSRGMRISGSNAGYTMFRGSVKSTGYPLHSPVSPSLPPPPRTSPCAITLQLDSTKICHYSCFFPNQE